MPQPLFRIWRGDRERRRICDYPTEVSEGMVVLDAIHNIQAAQANDLACRWNLQGGQVRSLGRNQRHAEAMCMTR